MGEKHQNTDKDINWVFNKKRKLWIPRRKRLIGFKSNSFWNWIKGDKLFKLSEKAKANPLIVLISVSLVIILGLSNVITNIQIIANFAGSIPFIEKHNMLSNIENLHAGEYIDVYKSKFGPPKFITTNDEKKFKEYIFEKPYFYLDAVTDIYGAVKYFAVTTRSASFNPIINLSREFPIILGKSRFSDMGSYFSYISLCGSVRTLEYYESYAPSSGSNLRDMAVGFNDVGTDGTNDNGPYVNFTNALPEKFQSLINDYCSMSPTFKNKCVISNIAYKTYYCGHTDQNVKRLEEFRSETVINTFAVSAPGVVIMQYNPVTLGIDKTLALQGS